MSNSPRHQQFIQNPTLSSDYNSIYANSISDSPYHDSPIFSMPPPPLISTKRKSKTQPIKFPNLSYSGCNKSPRKFYSNTNFSKGYKNQTQLLNTIEKDNKESRHTYRQNLNLSSYSYDNVFEYEKSRIRTRQMLNDRYREEVQNRRSINRQSQSAIIESFDHDLYHEDKLYSTHDKSLRIIPVTNRWDSFLPVKDRLHI